SHGLHTPPNTKSLSPNLATDLATRTSIIFVLIAERTPADFLNRDSPSAHRLTNTLGKRPSSPPRSPLSLSQQKPSRRHTRSHRNRQRKNLTSPVIAYL